MSRERWFPLRYELAGGIVLGRVLYSDASWQICSANNNSKVLIVRPTLAKSWNDVGLLGEGVMASVSFGDEHFMWLSSAPDHRLEPVDAWKSPHTKADGVAFAKSLWESRRTVGSDCGLHDSIYVERYSRLLPVWSVSEQIRDDVVLGQWLTGGVWVSATALRRLSNLLGWLSADDVRQIVEAAGVSIAPKGAERRSDEIRPGEDGREGAQTVTGQDQDRAAHKIGKRVDVEFCLKGRRDLEEFFREHVIDIIENKDRYAGLGIEFPSAIVLHGPPGCGKTYAVERLVDYLDWPMFSVDANSVGSPYIHETSRKIAGLFENAIDASPSVIVIDEMESYLSDRQLYGSAASHHVDEVAEFLRRIPEAVDQRVLVIGMTNRIDMIDSAILRRGRFDHVVEVGMPSEEEVRDLILSLLQAIPTCPSLDVGEAVQRLTGKPLSDTAFVVREAARLAGHAGKSAVDHSALESAVALLPEDKSKPRGIGFIRD